MSLEQQLFARFAAEPEGRRRVRELYLPIFEWVAGLSGKGTFLLGLNGPQGAGKSTLSSLLCELLPTLGKSAFCISIDDFYLTRSEQLTLAGVGNPYLQARGYPGTHDLALGERILQDLMSPGPGTVLVPRYDKSAHQGKGDRLPRERWAKVEKPVDILILEGWMLGFSPVLESQLPNEHFREINQRLAGYDAWHKQLHGFLQLEPENYLFVRDWRVEAEEKMKASGKPGMSEAEIRAYVETFLPAYATYLPRLREQPPTKNCVKRVKIGRDRLPL